MPLLHRRVIVLAAADARRRLVRIAFVTLDQQAQRQLRQAGLVAVLARDWLGFLSARRRGLRALAFGSLWLQTPCVGYGSKDLKSRPDLAAFFTIDGERFVLIGECAGQKPSTKFTPLLARLEELGTYLGVNAVRVLPVVFTPCDVSPADTRDAAHDGIIIVGKPQLAELLAGAADGWSARHVLQYFESLLTATTFPDGLL